MRAELETPPPRERVGNEAAQWDEVWNGVLHVPPMPNRMHQRFSRNLQIFLQTVWAEPRGCQVDQEVNLTTPEDEAEWTSNFRIPDLVLLTPDRFSIDRGEYMAGAPLVVIEIRSPRDETYAKFRFYASLGVPEVWVFDRDTREPEIYTLVDHTSYRLQTPSDDGWIPSVSADIEFLQAVPGKVWIRIAGNDTTARELGDS